jgi:hemolysin activation/secretion protein
VQLDTRASSSRKSGGLRLSATADVFPRLWNSQGTVAILETDARMYLPITRLPLEPVLALRAGARRSWGPYPWFDAAFVGGKTTLRGYGHDRFAGDAAAYAGADLRLLITRFARPVPGELGVLGLVDAGRVWLSGENSDQWHHSWGGGIWTSLIDPSAVFAATVARGAERTALYLTLGYAF